MLKTGILHPQLARVLAELRHRDTIIIGDAGLPIPKGVERVDLGWRPGDPTWMFWRRYSNILWWRALCLLTRR